VPRPATKVLVEVTPENPCTCQPTLVSQPLELADRGGCQLSCLLVGAFRVDSDPEVRAFDEPIRQEASLARALREGGRRVQCGRCVREVPRLALCLTKPLQEVGASWDRGRQQRGGPF